MGLDGSRYQPHTAWLMKHVTATMTAALVIAREHGSVAKGCELYHAGCMRTVTFATLTALLGRGLLQPLTTWRQLSGPIGYELSPAGTAWLKQQGYWPLAENRLQTLERCEREHVRARYAYTVTKLGFADYVRRCVQLAHVHSYVDFGYDVGYAYGAMLAAYDARETAYVALKRAQ